MIEDLYAWAHQQVTQNDVAGGLVAGSLFASALYASRSVPERLWRLFLLQGTTHLVVHNDDEAFDWLNRWLAQHPYARKTRRLKLSTFFMDEDDQSSERWGKWTLAPGPGAHLFWHRGRLVWMSREEQESDSGAGRRRKESIKIRVLGRSTSPIHNLIEEARALKNGGDRIDIYTYSGCWRIAARKLPRSLDTIILPQAQASRIVADAEWFFGAADWYRDRGVPYRRGYLLHGPPGCGKTSLVMALASYFRRPIYTLNLGSVWSDDKLFDALSEVPARAILLIEDIDASKASKSRTPRKAVRDDRPTEQPQGATDADGEADGMTMSGLLNALDGVASTDGRLLVMTTNHPEALDEALVRPGRVDRREEVSPLEAKEARRLFRRFYPEAQHLADRIDARTYTPMPAAALQGVFMVHADDPAAAAQAVTVSQAWEAAE